MSHSDISTHGGTELLHLYLDSPYYLLSSIYKWLPWKFAAVPRKYWRDIANQKKFLLSEELRLSDLHDITYSDVMSHGGSWTFETVRKLSKANHIPG